jgi:hypothetical protein
VVIAQEATTSGTAPIAIGRDLAEERARATMEDRKNDN